MGLHTGPPRRGWRLSILLLCLLALCGSPSFAQIAGTNVNMVSGTQWPGGDPFLQRQNEPSIAVSSRNPFHLLAGANDYRSVDLALTTNGETGDAWLGLFKSLDGGATWTSTLLPGCPYATTICSGAPSVKNGGYQAAADPTVRAGSNGMFYYSGLVFNRGFNPPSAIIVSRLIDLNNKENADPNDILNGDSIQYVSTSIVATGTQSLFLDKPTMAVDVPRWGAGTCNLSVNQPGNGVVNQSFPAGNVYVTYTAFQEAPNTDPEAATGPRLSTLYFVRSTNCGATWSKPLAISGNIAINQGTSIAIDPNLGTIYVAWREFAYKTATVNQPDAIVVAASIDGGQHFTPPLRISTFTPFDEGTTNTSFRTNAYPTIAVDNSSRVYVAYAARNTVPSGDARVVLTNSFLGLIWSAPVPIDNPPVDPITNPSGRGHQLMPALTFAGGRLSLLYYDLRLDHTFSAYTPLMSQGAPTGLYSQVATLAGELAQNPPELSAVFNAFIDDSTITIRRHTFDLRMTGALPGKSPVFAPSILVSQYAYGCCFTNPTDIEQLQFNAPNLPLFKSGTAPFMGDYIDLAPGPTILPPMSQAGQNAQGNDNNQGDEDGDSDDWHFNTSANTPTIYHAAWTDNRDVQPPLNGDWTIYTPPISPSLGATSIFEPGTTPPACRPGFTGSRNQNIYTAPISGGLIFGSPSNSKTLGTTVFNGKTVPFQRAFVVVAQNGTNLIKSFRLTIVNQPVGGNASFLQFSQLTTLDLSIPPMSSASRPVFVVSTNPTASVTINIAEITAPGGTLVTNGLTGATTLNPDATNPGITNPTETNPGITNPGITNFEVTNPGITNPGITNPTVNNPGITNPGITNPGITNGTFQNETVVNPGITNPGITNPGITNASIANPGITNPGITNVDPANVSISDTQWTVVNNGNTTGAYTVNLASGSPVPQGNVLQLIISKLYQTPANPSGQSCNLAVETHNTIVTNIVNPAVLSPANPGITNPGITNPGITNATVSLAPGETANIDVRVINTDIHTFPTFNAAASIVPVAVSQSVNTQQALASGGTGTGVTPPITVPPLIITTAALPDGVTGAVYTAQVATQGGNPTTHTFAVTSGGLPPGLTLGTTTGAITGIPTAVGTFTFTVQAQDVGSTLFLQNTATQVLTIRISAPLVITTAPTLATATQGGPYSQTVATNGGVAPFTFTVASGAPPPGLTMNSAGVIAGTPTGTGTSTFTVQVRDSSNPPQVTTQTFTITVTSTQIPAVVTFVAQPQNSVGGQVLGGSPVVVKVTDNTGAIIPNIPVSIGFNGAPPCAAATLGGTLLATTDATGQASFTNLAVDRGQLGYTLLAIAGNTIAVSSPFTVNGFCPTGSLSTARGSSNTSTLLPNGQVLIAGGAMSTGAGIATAELYDPSTGGFAQTGSMGTARSFHTATLLPTGKVLVVGGQGSANAATTAELYDPATGLFAPAADPNTSHNAHTATLLTNGKVLIAGGSSQTGELYDPITGLFTPTGTLTSIRVENTATLLASGKVLITGGGGANGPLATAEVYDPTSGNFTLTGAMSVPREAHAATLLPNGKVVVSGGLIAVSPVADTASADLYDPVSGTFTPTGSLNTANAFQAQTLLPDGHVLVNGGVIAETYDPTAGLFTPTGGTSTSHAQTPATLLNNGTVLVAGGNAGSQVAELYYSTAPLAPMAVTTTSLANGTQGQQYTQLLLEQGGVGTLAWSLASGALPSGIKLTSQGVLIGTPTQAGTFPITLTVTDSSKPAKTATSGTLTITVAGVPLQFTSNTVPSAGAGRFYSQSLPIIGGTQPYTVTQAGGTLPPGLSLSNNGTLAGTPSSAGSFTFTVQAVDSSTAKQTATQTFTLVVDTLFITTTALPNGIVNVAYNAPISTSGGTLPLFFSLANTAFPPGLRIQQPTPNSNAGALAGMPTQAGTFEFSESVTDSSNPSQTATQTYVVTIAPAGTTVPAHVSFVTQPQSSVGGQTLAGGPVVVSVSDANNAPIAGATVAMSFSGAPSCASAILSGTLEAVTGSDGQATFPNLSIDRGQLGYTLLASAGSAFAVSASFSVQGFCESRNMSTQREFPAQALLGNGKVLIAGGEDNNGNALNTAELYDPATGTTSPTGNLTDPNGRVLQVSVVLPNGKVLLAGGESNVNVLASAELYDPATGTFTATGSMSEARFLAEAVVLADGRVLVTGGANTNVGLNTAEIYDPATGLFTPTGNMSQPRIRQQMTLLPNGKVLVTGGRDAQANFFGLASAEIFDPLANQRVGAFTPIGNMNSARFVHTATLLPNGTVLIAGGFNAGNESLSVTSAEIYDPSANSFTLTGSMNIARARFTATLLPDGTVLMAGGINSVQGVAAPAPSEIYSPATGTFTLTGAMITGRELLRATPLFNGNVLVTGGDDGVNILDSTEVFYNTAPAAPVVITTTTLPNGFVSQPYVQLLQARNVSGPITWSVVSGALPPGINLFAPVPPGITSVVGASGGLSGRPTTAGSFTFTLQVADANGTATATFTVNVSVATLAFTSNTMPAGGVGRAYSQALPITGGTLPYTATVTSGSLPPGLALSSTGILGGTPTVAGSFTFTVNVADASTPAQSATQTLTMAVDSLFITTTALPNGQVGVAYNASISATGGTLPLVFSSATAAFPPGLTIQPISGLVSQRAVALFGTPTTAGHYTFSETVTDSSNPVQGATQTYTMDVFPAGSTATPATVTFVRQPQNSVGGQILSGSPIQVQVRDANNAPVGGASVAISFNGAPPCSSAVLSGTLTGITGSGGNAFFPDLSIDRGQLGYTLLASASSASAVSQPFTVNGFCPAKTPISVARELHSAVTLLDGTALVAGGGSRLPGLSSPGLPVASAELYNPSTGTFSPTGSMNVPRWGQTTTLLRDGRVLIAGGVNSSSTAVASVTDTAEIYNPATHTFTLTNGPMGSARFLHTATLLADGRVLVAGGGTTAPPDCIICFGVTTTNTAEIFDPATGLFSSTSTPLVVQRQASTATLMPNGQVLLAGGLTDGPTFTSTSSAEIFDPVSNGFRVTSSMTAPRVLHSAALLPSGKVLVAGGTFDTTATAELYDPATGTFAATGNLVGPSGVPAIVLTDGTVLLSSKTTQVYNGSTGAFTATGELVVPQNIFYGVSLLQDGTVLTTGGETLFNTVPDLGTITDAEIYYSTAPLAPLQVTTPTAAPPGTTVFTDSASFGAAASGSAATGFNGILPAGSPFVGFTPLVLNGITFSTPLSTSGVNVNVTRSTFYTPNNYTADFITDSVVPATGQPSGNNTVVITLPVPTTAFAMDFGGLGFRGASTATITLSNGFSLPLSSLPTVGHTEFRGFVSTTPFNTITFSTVNDDFVVLDVLVASADIVLPAAVVGKPYTQILLEQGGLGTLTWTPAGGALPPGVTLRSDGVLLGTPTAGGTFTFAVHVVDSSTPQKSIISGNFILTVQSALTFPAQTLNTGIVGTPYGGAITASGGTAPYSFAVTSGTTPAGITLLSNSQFTGTPTTPLGTSSFTVTVTDSSVPAQTASQTFSIQVVNPLTISTTTLPAGQVGLAYTTTTIGTTGGVAPVTSVVGAGTFPPGLTLASNGTISGTPTSAGTFSFTVSATDSSVAIPQSALQNFTVTIAPAAIGPAATINFVTQPSATTAGQPLSPAMQLRVADANGNGVPGVTVTLGIGAAPNRPILSGTLSAVTDATGTATFSNVILDRAGTGYTLVASVAVVSSSGEVQQISAPASVLQGALESDTQIQLFGEQGGVTLSAGATADITNPGTYSNAASLTTGTIPAGTKVDSYYLHSDPVGISSNVVQLLSGGVTFPTNVLGVVILDPSLTASNPALGVAGTQYPTTGRGLTLGSPTDTVILSADQRTLTLHLSASNATKGVRVITVANSDPNLVQITSAPFNSAAAPGSITTVAGSTWVFPGVAGVATSVPLGLAGTFTQAYSGMVSDQSGNIYFPDLSNNMIFKLSGTALSVVAGTGVEGYAGDGGAATSARLDSPSDVAFSPAGDLYIADTANSVIRKVDSAGKITTFAGNGTSAESGDGGPATSASLAGPSGIAFDAAGDLYIADNGTIREVNASGTISTVSLTPVPAGTPGLCAPQGLRRGPDGSIYVADFCNRVFKFNSSGSLTLVAGNGNESGGYAGDGGPATSALLSDPSALAFDGQGNLYITDELNNVIREVNTAGTISTVAGIAASGFGGFAGDGGPGTAALLAQPGGLAFDASGSLYVADMNNERIRRLDTTNTITTVAGNGRFKYAGDGGAAISASLDSPEAVALDPTGNLFVADIANTVVRKVSPAGVISTYVGTGIKAPTYTGDGGPATSATISFPGDVQADSAGNLFLIEGDRVHKISSAGTMSTLFNGGLVPAGSQHLAMDSQGNLYFAAPILTQVLKLDTTGAVTVVAGTGGRGFSGDGGPATSATLSDIRGLAADSAGNLYISDRANNRVRKVDTSGIITTVAGNSSTATAGDGGPATGAGVPGPFSLAVDGAGNLYITTANRIRKVDGGGTITTIAGGGFVGSTVDGVPALNATFNAVQGLAFDAAGNLYVGDRFDDRVRKITSVTNAPPFIFNPPSGLTVATKGLPHGTVGTAYFQTLSAVGGASPYTWSISSGSLPAGLTLSSAGAISGTPTTAGASTFAVKVTDSTGVTATQSFTLTVVAPLAITTTTLPNGTAGTLYPTATIAATGGSGTVSFAVTSGTLPTGLTLSAPGALSGTPAAAGTFSFTITATDQSTPPQHAAQPYTVTIAPAQVPANVTFVSQPQNSVAGQVLVGSPLKILVTDSSNNPIPNVSVSLAPGPTVPVCGKGANGPAPQTTDATGTATFANLIFDHGGFGLTIAATAGTVTGLSNPFNIEGFCATATPDAARFGATATLLQNGKVLLTGGVDAGTPSSVVATAELYDPVARTMTPTGSMSAPRAYHTATPLNDGTVLIAGGTATTSGPPAFQPGLATPTAEIYNPTTGVFTPLTATMNSPRALHSATQLPDGTILVAGGSTTGQTGFTYSFVGAPFTTFTGTSCPPVCRITGSFTLAQPLAPNLNQNIGGSGAFTPASFSFTDGVTTFTNLNTSSSGFAVDTDANGKITLYSFFMSGPGGGAGLNVFFDGPGQDTQEGVNLNNYQASFQGVGAPGGIWTLGPQINSADIYDPIARTFAATNGMTAARSALTATALTNGKVLLAGGFGALGPANQSAELYDPFAKTFNATPPMAFAHAQHTATLLPNGQVALIGGDDATGASTNHIEIFDPVAGTFTASAATLNPTARTAHGAVLLPDGRVLVDSGIDASSSILNSAETFNSVSATSTPTGSMQSTRAVTTNTLLPDGTVLVAGGAFGSAGLTTLPAEVFYPIAQPTGITFPFTLLSNATQNQPYSQQLLEQGGVGKLTWVLSPSSLTLLPPGLTLSTSGLISGTPTQFGASEFTAQVADSSTPPKTASFTYALVVLPQFQFFPLQMNTAFSGTPYSAALPLVGGTPPYSSTMTGGILPAGLTFANGTVSGTTTALGTYTLTFQATDSSVPPQFTTATVTLGVTTPLAITTTTLPAGALNSSYSATIGTSGGLGTIVIGPTSVTGLPPGLVFNPNGVISGTPTQTGTFTFAVEAVDQSFPPQTATQAESITITTATAPLSLSPNPLNLLANNTGSMTVTLSAPAGANGQQVGLTSSNSGVASVSPTVNVLPNANSASFSVQAGANAGSATITASAPGSTSGTATVVVATRPMALATDGPLLATTRTFNATVTLAQPAGAGGVIVALAANPTGLVTITPASQTIAAGQTSAVFSLTAGATAGSLVLTASASGYTNATAPLTVTTAVISLQTGVTVAPGQSVSMALSVSQPAPVGGLTLNLTSSAQGNATVTPSVFIPAGAQTPSSNPQVTGVLIGSTNINATAVGFGPDTQPVNVTVTATLSPNPVTVISNGGTKSATLTISAPAPVGGITFSLSTDSSATAAVPAQVTVIQGATSVQFLVTGVAAASTTLRADSPGITEATASVNVTLAPSISLSSLTIGQNLQAATNMFLGAAAPAGGVTVTVTSPDTTKVLLSQTGKDAGSGTQQFTVGAGNSFVGTLFVYALQGSGTVQISASAQAYVTGTATITLDPSGFIINSPGSINTTTFSLTTPVQVTPAVLTPGTLTYAGNQPLRPGVGPFSISLSLAAASVGTLTPATVTFNGGDTFQNSSFQPATTPGSTTLNLGAPPTGSGFTTPSNFQQIPVDVSLPTISVGSPTIGFNLQSAMNVFLSVPPPNPVNVTFTVDSTKLLLSTTGTDAGSGTVTFNNVSSTFIGTLFVYALQNSGTAPITAAASGYSNGSGTVTMEPSGFIINFPGSINTTTFSTATTVQVTSVALTPGTLTYNGNQTLRPGIGPFNISLSMTGGSPGTLTPATLTFPGGSSFENASFQPTAAGTATINLGAPPTGSGFSTPSNFQQIPVSVTAPAISLSPLTIGNNLQSLMNVFLGATPPNPVTVTLTTDSTKLLLSTTGTDTGSGTVTFNNVSSTFVGTLFVYALQGAGTPQITASALGYATATSTVTLQPSGFIINSPGSIATTTFATATPVNVTSAVLTPGTLTWLANQPLRPGIGPFSISLALTGGTPGTLSPTTLTFPGGNGSQNSSFQPSNAGTATIALGTQPGGFTTSSNFQQIPVSVTAPAIEVASPVTVGLNLQVGINVFLQNAPPNPVTVTVTSPNSSIAAVTTDATQVGGAMATFSNVTGTFVGNLTIQGMSLNSTQLKVQAPGYADAFVNVTVNPSGFIINTPGSFNASSGSTTLIQIVPAVLDPTTLNFAGNQPLRAGASVSVAVNSSNTAVGTISSSPLLFTGNVFFLNTSFQAMASGTSFISVPTPPGFSTPGDFTQIQATVQ